MEKGLPPAVGVKVNRRRQIQDAFWRERTRPTEGLDIGCEGKTDIKETARVPAGVTG